MKTNSTPPSKFFIPFSFFLFVFFFHLRWNRVSAQTPDWQWAKRAGGTDNDNAPRIATDASGNFYVTGGFASATITFGSFTLNNAGSGTSDFFLVKYDPNGNVLWAKNAGGTQDDFGLAITTDVNGSVIISGAFSSSSIAFGTTLTNANSGLADLFIVKYDFNGNVLWAKRAGGSNAEGAYGISTDANSNIFVTGLFYSSSITFGTTPAIANSGSGTSDVFIVKYDPLGNAIWAAGEGDIGNEIGYSISNDINGNVIVGGAYYSSSMTIGSNSFVNDGSGTGDIFLAKYDNSGNLNWAKTTSNGTADENVIDISQDNNGNIYLTGIFQSSTITFNSINLSNSGISDIYLVKFDPSGNVTWAKRAGGNNDDWSGGIVYNNGKLFITGYFYSPSIAFGTNILNNAGSNIGDIFVAEYDVQGNPLWAYSAGGSGDEAGVDIAADLNGNICVAGLFKGANLILGNTTLTNASSGTNDIFISKLSFSSISGTIYKTDNITQITSGKVYLIDTITTTAQFAFVDSFTLNGTSGAYSFTNVNPGVYLVLAKPNESIFPNTGPAYYGDTSYWKGATSIAFSSGISGINIRVKDLPDLWGYGSFFGKVQFGIGSGKTNNGTENLFGDPVPDIDIILEEIPGGIKAHTNTDNSGNYVFGQLPSTTFRLLVDIPGLQHILGTYTILIPDTNQPIPFSNLDFVVDTTTTLTEHDAGIYIGYPLGIPNLGHDALGFNVYPNPNNGTFIVELSNIKYPATSIKIFNVLGEIVYLSTLNGKQQIVNLTSPPGIYNVQMEIENGVFNKNIVVE